MPQPPKLRVSPPKAPRQTARAPRLRLSPIRGSQSLQLDERRVRPRGESYLLPGPPFQPWGEFVRWFSELWEAGEHVALVGMTGSGKTVLARHLIELRDFVVVFGTKARDESLYDPLQRAGFVVKRKWTPWEWEQTRERFVIFAPELELSDDPGPRETLQAQAKQSEAFRAALVQIFKAGGWCCYFDEVRYLADDLNLSRELNLLWLQGRSLGVTMVAATQRPRAVPLNTFEQAVWTFLFRVSDRDDRRRASEYMGGLAPIIFDTAGALPRHEFVCVNGVDDLAVRSKVRL